MEYAITLIKCVINKKVKKKIKGVHKKSCTLTVIALRFQIFVCALLLKDSQFGYFLRHYGAFSQVEFR